MASTDIRITPGKASTRVSAVDDDDDVSLSFLDGLTDDEVEEPAPIPAKQPRKARGEPARASAPAAKPDSANSSAAPANKKPSDGYERIQFYRALQGFLQAMVEAAPMYLGQKLKHPELSDAELGALIGNACKEHLALVDRCLEANNADAGDIMLRYQRRTLAKNLAGLYKDNEVKEVQGLVDVAQQWMLTSSEFENASAEYTSGDGVLNVRLGLFVAALKGHFNLDAMWGPLSPAEVLPKLQQIALGMANEIAFHWSDQALIADKESLFQTAVPLCLEITEHAYKEIAIKELPPIEYLYTDPMMKLTRFEDAVEDMDVGYLGNAREELHQRVRETVRGLFGRFKTPTLSFNDTCRWYSAYIAEIDTMLSRSWNDAANDFVTEMHKMSPDERARFLEDNQSMDTTLFFENFMIRLDGLESPLVDMDIDFDLVAERAKRHLAWLWGISDSLIAARSENVPEELV